MGHSNPDYRAIHFSPFLFALSRTGLPWRKTVRTPNGAKALSTIQRQRQSDFEGVKVPTPRYTFTLSEGGRRYPIRVGETTSHPNRQRYAAPQCCSSDGMSCADHNLFSILVLAQSYPHIASNDMWTSLKTMASATKKRRGQQRKQNITVAPSRQAGSASNYGTLPRYSP